MTSPWPLSLAASLLLAAGAVTAQTPPAADDHNSHHAAAQTKSADLSEGEITRLDAQALKLTLRHGELKTSTCRP